MPEKKSWKLEIGRKKFLNARKKIWKSKNFAERFNIFFQLVNEGNLLEDFTPPVNPPSEIDDPNDRKPSSWDEREQIPDPEAQKPEDWDEEAPRKIQDPSAVKPDDWLEQEPTMIPDPDAEKPSDW